MFFIIIFFFSILIIGHELGHFIAAKLAGVRVEEFGLGLPPRLAAFRLGETAYSVNLFLIGGFVRLHGEGDAEKTADTKRSFAGASAFARACVIASGVAANFLLAWFALSLIFARGIPASLEVTAILPGSPALTAGIEAGDLIVSGRAAGESGEGRKFSSGDDFIGFLGEHEGRSVELSLVRGGKAVMRELSPHPIASPEEGRIGVELKVTGLEPRGIAASVADGFRSAVSIASRSVAAVAHLIRGGAWSEISGPVGVVSVLSGALSEGFSRLVELFAIISLNLAILNLMPIPALDGGRLLLLLVEKIRGKPLPRAFEVALHRTSFALLFLVMILVTIRDVGRLVW